MHVAIVDTNLTTAPTGGGQTFLVGLADGLVRRGWRVTVITKPGRERSILLALRERGAIVLDGIWKLSELPEERALRLAEWINRVGPAVYVVSDSPDVGWLALPLLDHSVATMSIAHNDVGAYYTPLAHYGPFVDRAIGVSEEVCRQIGLQAKIPGERVLRIPYGVKSVPAEGLWNNDPCGALRIGYIGRIVQEQKRVLDLVPMAAELRRRRVPFRLDLIGDGADRPRLEFEFRRNDLAEYVRHWGWLEPNGVANRLRDLDVFVLLSEMEGLPVALLEAMAHGLAPIVTRIASGNTELVQDGFNGFLVPIGDTTSVVDRLELLVKDRALLGSIRRRAWDTALDYSQEATLDRYVACFDELARPEGRRVDRPEPGAFPLLHCCRSRYPRWIRKAKWKSYGLLERMGRILRRKVPDPLVSTDANSRIFSPNPHVSGDYNTHPTITRK